MLLLEHPVEYFNPFSTLERYLDNSDSLQTLNCLTADSHEPICLCLMKGRTKPYSSFNFESYTLFIAVSIGNLQSVINIFMIDNTNVPVNIAYQNKWKLVCHRLPGIEFHCKAVEFPSISLQPIASNTPVGKFHKGGKLLDYGQFTFNFQIDEKFLNYQSIYDWMVGITGSIDISNYSRLVNGSPELSLVKGQHNIYTDATLVSLTNSMNTETEFLIRNMFPINLSAPTFSFDVDQPNTASVTFQTDYYEIVTKEKIA